MFCDLCLTGFLISPKLSCVCCHLNSWHLLSPCNVPVLSALAHFEPWFVSFSLTPTSSLSGDSLALPIKYQHQFSSVPQSCLILCDPMDWSTPGLPVHHQIPEFTQTHAHWVGDAIQPSHPLASPSPPAFNLSQHQGLFKWVSSSHQVPRVLELQLQHQSFQWIFRTDFL